MRTASTSSIHMGSKCPADADVYVRWCDCSISSYGDRPNTYEEVSEYFRAHFIQVHRRKDAHRRTLYTVSHPGACLRCDRSVTDM